MAFIVSECGVNHLGDFKVAKEMIRISKEVGADAVKFQAYKAKDIANPTHINWKLYNQVEFNIDQYIELFTYGLICDIPVFYSIFSEEFQELKRICPYIKYAARQFSYKDFKEQDRSHFIFSIPNEVTDLPRTKYNQVLHVTDYISANPRLEKIGQLAEFFERPIGYSDHTIGIANCILAAKEYNAHIIEKHFYLKKSDIKFRDFEHGINPKDMEVLIKEIKK